MHFLAVARVDWMRLSLITIPSICALIVDLYYHTLSYRNSVGRVPVALRCNVPALATSFADTRDYAGGAAIDTITAKVVAARIGEII